MINTRAFSTFVLVVVLAGCVHYPFQPIDSKIHDGVPFGTPLSIPTQTERGNLIAEGPSTVLRDSPICEFLLQDNAQQLFSHSQDYEGIALAVASFYLVPDSAVEVNIIGPENLRSHLYQWFLSDPYFGELYYTAVGDESSVEDVFTYSLNKQPPAFTLEDIFACVGTPTAWGTFLAIIDDPNGIEYGEPVESLSLYYRNRNLLLKLVRAKEDNIFNSHTRVYLIGTEIYSQAIEQSSVAEKIEQSFGELDLWPPPNWVPNP